MAYISVKHYLIENLENYKIDKKDKQIYIKILMANSCIQCSRPL